MNKIIVAAISRNGVIGDSDKIPWHSKRELEHFKNITSGFPVVMGRKTYDSIKSPLKNRINIVLSRNKKLNIQNDKVVLLRSIDEVYDFCNINNFTKLFFIGGGEIYKQMINQVDKLIISKMNFSVEGDTFFPKINELIWKLSIVEDHGEFKIETYLKYVHVK